MSSMAVEVRAPLWRRLVGFNLLTGIVLGIVGWYAGWYLAHAIHALPQFLVVRPERHGEIVQLELHRRHRLPHGIVQIARDALALIFLRGHQLRRKVLQFLARLRHFLQMFQRLLFQSQ